MFMIYILFFLYFSTYISQESSCDDWEAFTDEKCYKIFDETLVNYDNATKSCAQQNRSGTLAIIRSKEEQEFITNFVFNTKKVEDNVWIGIRNTSLKFARSDNLELVYTNWSPGSPQNETDYSCVQMVADKSMAGKWINGPCGKKNAVLCQKRQVWSNERIQQVLMEERYQLHEEIKNLKQNLVPIGFIYAQLPGQSEPKLVWPTYIWEDVSSKYAGLFFRVLGGNSAAFDTEQNENDRYLQSVRQTNELTGLNVLDIPLNGKWSSGIFSGRDQGTWFGHQFKLSNGEVRPRNKAIKVWKRIA